MARKKWSCSGKTALFAVAVAVAAAGACVGAPVGGDAGEGGSELVSVEDGEEDVGEGRFLASFFFPLFPQYWPIDLGENLNNLKSPKTVARFVYRDITSVRISPGKADGG